MHSILPIGNPMKTGPKKPPFLVLSFCVTKFNAFSKIVRQKTYQHVSTIKY